MRKIPPQCGKVRYRTQRRALMVMERIARRRAQGAQVERSAYLCPKCHGWHLTSSLKRRRPRRPLVSVWREGESA